MISFKLDLKNTELTAIDDERQKLGTEAQNLRTIDDNLVSSEFAISRESCKGIRTSDDTSKASESGE